MTTRWERMRRLIIRWLPLPIFCHRYPSAPHERNHLKQEPDAVMPLVRTRGGGCEQSCSLLRLVVFIPRKANFRTPDIPPKSLQYSSFSGGGCEPKTVRFLRLQR